MQRSSSLLLLFLGITFVFSASILRAETRHPVYCDGIESTAEAQSCVKDHNDDAKRNLGDLYNSLLKSPYLQKDQTLLRQSQLEWIEYRDVHCAWEASLAPSPSLKRVYELSCMTDLTEKRYAVLDYIKAQQEDIADVATVIGNLPRWVNVLNHNHPEVYWKYDHQISFDMDCDETKDIVIKGLLPNPENSGMQKGKTLDIVIAVTSNPVNGKPKASLYRVPVIPNTASMAQNTPQSMPHLCSGNASIEVIGSDKSSCGGEIKISDGVCDPVYLIRDSQSVGQEYRLSLDSALSKETE